jgi:hypothetical protein
MRIIQTTELVANSSIFVSIDKERAMEYARVFEHGSTRHWLSAAPFDFSDFTDDEKLSFLFIFNALSFCYWGEPKWTVEQDGNTYDGAWGMIVALGRAVRAGIPILDAGYCADLSSENFSKVLKGNTEIPLIGERLRIIKELGANAQQRPFKTIVNSANGDAMSLLDVILETFPSFYDESEYQGRTVYFEKRAQLLVSDIFSIFAGRGYGNLRGVDRLTACADYKLPQILRKLGILHYAPELAAKVDAKIELAHGSPEEVEIRAGTIQAIKLIKNEVCKRVPAVTSIGINDHLWLMTQEKFPDDKPYHRTRTTAY